MSRNILFAAVIAFVPALVAVAGPKEDVLAASKKLSDSPSYSWKTTVEGGAGARAGGATEGKTEKDGFTWFSITQRNNASEVVIKGDKGAVKLADGWKSLEEASAAPADATTPNPGRNLARMAKAFKSPAAQAEEMAGKATDLATSEDAIAGALPEDVVKQLMTVGGGRRRGANAAAAAPTVTNAKGTVKFWVKDGVLTKMQTNVKGTVNANGQDREIDRTTTVEITDVGTTKLDIPAEAKAKAGA